MRIRSCFCAQMLESSISISLIRIWKSRCTSLLWSAYFVDLLSLSDRSILHEVYRVKYITIKMLLPKRLENFKVFVLLETFLLHWLRMNCWPNISDLSNRERRKFKNRTQKDTPKWKQFNPKWNSSQNLAIWNNPKNKFEKAASYFNVEKRSITVFR